MAERKGCQPSQLALAVELTADDLAEIDRVSPKAVAAGELYAEVMMSAINR